METLWGENLSSLQLPDCDDIAWNPGKGDARVRALGSIGVVLFTLRNLSQPGNHMTRIFCHHWFRYISENDFNYDL